MAESLETGFVLMATGMGTVFMLLTVLVWLVRGVSKLSLWIGGPAPVAPAEPPPVSPPVAPAAETELVTVIGAVVAAFERDSRRS